MKCTFTYFSLAGHFQNQTGHFWPVGKGLDGPVIDDVPLIENDSFKILGVLFGDQLLQGRPTPCPRVKSGPFDFESGPLEKNKKKYISLFLYH